MLRVEAGAERNWMKQMPKTRAVIVVSCLAAAVITCAYVFQAAFDESRYFQRTSVDYFLLMDSEYVRRFPVPKDAMDVRYHSSCGDGPKPPSVAVEFWVHAIDDTYVKDVENFIQGNRLRKAAAKGLFDPSSVYLDDTGGELELAWHRRKEGYSVVFEHRH